MLVIRLARTGRNKYPTYRIVAAESARAATGKFVAVLGHYNPHSKDLVLKKDEILKYIANGAQPSNRVIILLKQEKVKLPDWVQQTEKHKAPKKAPVEKAAAVPAAEEADEAQSSEETPANEEAAESTEEVVAEVAAAEAADKDTSEAAAPEDTADGEATQAEANTTDVEAAGDAAVAAVSAETAGEPAQEDAA